MDRLVYAFLLLFLCGGHALLSAGSTTPLDESNKKWIYDSEEQSIMFLKPGERYHKGDIKILLGSSKVRKQYFPNGDLQALRYKQGNVVIFLDFYPSTAHYPKENVVYLSRMFIDVDGSLLLNDYVRIFDRHSNLLEISKWRQGVLHGEYKVFNSSGVLIEEHFYDGGIPVGRWRKFYGAGKLASEVLFPEDLQGWGKTTDASLNYYLNSDSKQIISQLYSYPQKTVERWFSEKGYLAKEMELKVFLQKGEAQIERTGKALTFDESGKLIKKSDVLMGYKTTKARFYTYGSHYEEKSSWFMNRPLKTSWIQYPGKEEALMK